VCRLESDHSFAVPNEVNAREHFLPVAYLFALHFQFEFPQVLAVFVNVLLCSIRLSLSCCFR